MTHLQDDSTVPLLGDESSAPTTSDAPHVPQQHVLMEEKCHSPRRVMFVLTLSLFLVFIDRGAIGTNGVNGHEEREGREATGLRAAFEMSNFQNGLIPACLMVGRVIGSFMIAQPPPHWSPMTIVGIGMWLWVLGTIGCGASFHFAFFACCRIVMGIGQAPLFNLAHVVLDDVAPIDSVGTWLSLYQMACPVGTAVGFWYGSGVANALSWRHSFYFQSILAIPVLILCFTEKKFNLKKNVASENGTHEDIPKTASLLKGMQTIFTHVLFNLSLLGSSLYRGYLTTTEYWVARSLEAKFGRDGADVVMGIVILVSSTIGGFAGGQMVDTVLGGTVWSSFIVAGVSLTGVWSVMIIGELICNNYYGMIAVYVAMFAFLFAPLGAVGVAVMWTVPLDMRPLAKVVETACTQLLGTIPEPALYGAFLDIWEDGHSERDSHRYAMTAVTTFVVISSVLFLVGAYISPKHPNYRVTSSK